MAYLDAPKEEIYLMPLDRVREAVPAEFGWQVARIKADITVRDAALQPDICGSTKADTKVEAWLLNRFLLAAVSAAAAEGASCQSS